MIEGPSDEGFFVYPAYGRDRNPGPRRAGAPTCHGFTLAPQRRTIWTLRYHPVGAGSGRITVTLDARGAELDLRKDYRRLRRL